jgi:hypothetical protein
MHQSRQLSGPGNRELTRRQIQSTWSDEERQRRRALAHRRQQQLLGLILRGDASFVRDADAVAAG